MTSLEVLKQKCIYVIFKETNIECPDCSKRMFIENKTQIVKCKCGTKIYYSKRKSLISREYNLKLLNHIKQCNDEDLLLRLYEQNKKMNRMNEKEFEIFSKKQDERILKILARRG